MPEPCAARSAKNSSGSLTASFNSSTVSNNSSGGSTVSHVSPCFIATGSSFGFILETALETALETNSFSTVLAAASSRETAPSALSAVSSAMSAGSSSVASGMERPSATLKPFSIFSRSPCTSERSHWYFCCARSSILSTAFSASFALNMHSTISSMLMKPQGVPTFTIAFNSRAV